MLLVPRMLSSAALGPPPIVPSIATFGVATSQAPACGVPWIAQFSWTVADPNNVTYKLVLIDNGTGLPFAGADNLDCADGAFQVEGTSGGVGTGYFQSVDGTLQLVRRGDNDVIQDEGPEVETYESGNPC